MVCMDVEMKKKENEEGKSKTKIAGERLWNSLKAVKNLYSIF